MYDYMIRFFKGMFASRLIALILLYLLIRLPLLFLGVPETLPELRWMLIGQRMANGYAMYRDIFDTTAPFAAGIYWLIDLTAGRSWLVYRLVAALLILLQALRLNSIFNRNNVHGEKTHLPALLYLVLGSIFFEYDMLTPMLIGNTFIVYALSYLITFSKEGYNNRKLFKAGFLLGMAALSYLPLAMFIVMAFFAVQFFASNAFRSFLLLLCGILFPLSVVLTYYSYTNALDNFWDFHLSPWHFGISYLLTLPDVLKILALPIVVLGLSLLRLSLVTLGLNYQVKFQQLMYVWLFTGILVALTGVTVSSGTFLVFLPAVAYFGTFLFSFKKRAWMLEIFFLLVLAVTISLRYYDILQLNQFLKLDTEPLLVKNDNPKYTQVQNADILVLSTDLNYYRHNKLGSPYLDWDLARQHFRDLDNYQTVFRLYRNFSRQHPSYIIDPKNLMPTLQFKIPLVFGKYKAVEGQKGIYKRLD